MKHKPTDYALVHFSTKPIEALHSVDQRDGASERRSSYDKPRGLWVSTMEDDGWHGWCKSEEFGRGDLGYSVTLAPNAKIKLITNVAELDRFARAYQWTETHEFTHRTGTYTESGIDWAKVAKRYQGILIIPYLWERRLAPGSNWYYGWDCASGCIWDAEAVAGIKLVPELSRDDAEAEAERARLAKKTAEREALLAEFREKGPAMFGEAPPEIAIETRRLGEQIFDQPAQTPADTSQTD